MEKLTKEEVYHVSSLGKIALNDNEVEEYREKLTKILEDINKIYDVEVNEELMYTPSNNINKMHDDVPENMLDVKDVLKNASKVDGDYIEVGGVYND